MIRVRVSGVDPVVRSYNRKKAGIEDALTDGTNEAADYLIECIEEKFGTYQPGWAPLKYETIVKERRMGYGANASSPLVMTADMMFSFYKQTSARTRKHTVWVLSDDPKLKFHMYGAPGARVPKRDPVRPTVKEENDKCLDIIRDAVRRALRL